MKSLLCIYQYFVINFVIVHVTCKLLSKSCNIRVSKDCYNCNSDISAGASCSINATIHSSENLMKDSATRSYYFSASWYLNGKLLKAESRFTAKRPIQTCSTSQCTIITNLLLPKDFSSRYHGIYTQNLKTSKEKGGESVSCFVNICSENNDFSNETDNNDTEDGILIRYLYVYIIAGVAAFVLLLFITLTVTVIRLKLQVKIKNRPPRSRDDDEISVDDVSAAVSNHTYASVQLSVPGRYHTLGSRSPSSRHRYDEPTLGRNDQPQYLEMSASVSRSASPQRKLTHHYENDGKKIEESGEELESTSSNMPDIPGQNLVSALDLIKKRQQKSNVPDIIVHDYQNIRRTRRLT